MQAIKVAVVTWFAAHDDPVVRDGREALQTQVDTDFRQAWNLSAHLDVIGNDQVQHHMPDHWGLIVYDDSTADVPDRYGDLTHGGLPLAKAYVPPGVQWTLPASRALLQMLANPRGDLAVYDEVDPETNRFVAIRVCDPVQSDDDAYQVQVDDGTWWPVSDFVYPSWFRTLDPDDARLDRQGRVSMPFQLSTSGGLAYVFEVSSSRWWVRSTEGGQPETTRPVAPGAMPAVLRRPTPAEFAASSIGSSRGTYPPP
ncbi:MAG TPA: hypothetical protein VOB72_21315 [Candidatus Dormibacteraeota bacterium]|nr:hypothetical protein [Candidatus Dormibacteraeota bacterium]